MELEIINDCRGMGTEEIKEAIYDTRDIYDLDEFFTPDLEENLYPYKDLKNIEKAGEMIISNMGKDIKILVHADVDNDGVSSGTIMYRYLKWLGFDVDWTINPEKLHGTSTKLFNKVRDVKPDILIIVDSLDADETQYKDLCDLCKNIIVLDHHNINTSIPYEDYITLVSSNNDYPNPELSGSGVCWKFCMYLDSLLGTDYALELADLAASGIISDMVDLSLDSKENRAIVHYGLENSKTLPLNMMRGNYDMTSQTIAFSIAPKVNACNRLDKNEEAMKVMLCDDKAEIKEGIKLLDKIREKQKELVAEIMPDAISQLDEQKKFKVGIVVLDTADGLKGLVANNLMSQYGKPIIAVTEKETEYSGSARGLSCIDFNALCTDTQCCACAGHDNAFGIEIPYNSFDLFRERIEESLADVHFENKYSVDAQIECQDVNSDLIDWVLKMNEVSGQGFPPVKFAIELDDFEVSNMGKGKHLKLIMNNMIAIKWNFDGDWDELNDAQMLDASITVVGTLQQGFYGRTFYKQLIIEDYQINW